MLSSLASNLRRGSVSEIDDVLDCIVDIQGFAVIFQLFCQAFCLLWFNAHRLHFPATGFLFFVFGRAWPGGWQDARGPWLGLLCVVWSAVGHQDRSLQSPPARQSHHLISVTATLTSPLLSSPLQTDAIIFTDTGDARPALYLLCIS